MNGKTILCIDTEALKRPGLVGLNDEDIASQNWLEIYNVATDARNALKKDRSCNDVWVVSCDDMEGINLAAALKHDSSESNIELVSFGGTGSEVGRCEAAGVGLIRGRSEFVKRYSEQKIRQGFSNVVSAEGSRNVQDNSSEFDELLIEEPPAYRFESVSAGQRSRNVEASPLKPKAVKSQQQKRQPVSRPKPQKTAQSGFVVSVLSGNGGVGKSTISACLAVLLQERGLKTALLDFDLQFGDAGFLLGLDKVLGIDELLMQPGRIAQIVPKDGIPAVVGAPDRLEQSEAVAPHIADAIDLLRSRFDAVVVNTGSFWSDSHIQIIESSDQVLFVLDQRPSSVRSCSRALDLCARCGIAVQPFRFVLNLCSKHALLTSMDVSCALHGMPVNELRDGGREVGELLGAGLPLELMGSKNPFIESLKELSLSLDIKQPRTRIDANQNMQLEKKPLFGGLRKRRTA